MSFRWMGLQGSIVNPEPDRPIRQVILDVKSAYAAEEPALRCKLGETPASVVVEQKLMTQGWRVALSDGEMPARVRTLTVESLKTACPAKIEGSHDTRELSICLLGAMFVYAQ